jgi:hypothetical protein
MYVDTMPPTDTTTAQRLASHLLDQPVQEWIVAQRARPLSWRAIASLLEDETDGQVLVSHETIRAWSQQDAA